MLGDPGLRYDLGRPRPRPRPRPCLGAGSSVVGLGGVDELGGAVHIEGRCHIRHSARSAGDVGPEFGGAPISIRRHALERPIHDLLQGDGEGAFRQGIFQFQRFVCEALDHHLLSRVSLEG